MAIRAKKRGCGERGSAECAQCFVVGVMTSWRARVGLAYGHRIRKGFQDIAVDTHLLIELILYDLFVLISTSAQYLVLVVCAHAH